MNATLYRKNRKHWSEPSAVVSPAQGIDIIFSCVVPPASCSEQNKANRSKHITCLKKQEMKGGCA